MLDSLKKIYTLFLSRYRMKLAILFGMMLMASVLEIMGIGMIPAFVIVVTEDPSTVLGYPVIGDWLRYFGITTSREMIISGALTLIGVFVVKNLYLSFFLYLKKRFIANRGVYLQDRLFRAYMTAPYSFYTNRNSAELLRNITNEVQRIVTGTMMPFMELSLNFCMTLFIIASLMYVDPVITVAAIVVMGGGGYAFLKFTQRKTDEYGKKDRDARGEMNKAVIQGLGGFKEARILNREKMFLNHYREYAEVSKRANIFKYVINNLPNPIIETIAVTGILMIVFIRVLEGSDFNTIVPILVFFGAATVRLMPILKQVISKVTDLRYNVHSVYAIYDDLMLLENEYKDFRKQVLRNRERMHLKDEIRLEKVSYSYEGSEEQAVRNATFSIKKGSAVAFAGATGAGKTTMVDVILGLLQPQEGRITVDGMNIHDNIRGWQQNVGYIPQSIYLLDESIRRNIAFGIPDEEIDEESVWEAIRAAQLEEMIGRLPKGLDTVVGERGVRLSGGQQQRIGIARALYSNPALLVMDEATSSLDNLTEKYVIDAIERLKGDRTIIMIAHRLTTVKNCDTIFMMKEGEIVDRGTYHELLEDSKDFRRMSLVED
ncbi:MAG: ABC transporter ATP-binding protein [Balneolaceae bacterium]|nr:ABC transporter ATP-binding protein [Balneolaceae bacterium]